MANRNDFIRRPERIDRDLSSSPPGSRIPQTPRPTRDSIQGVNPRRQVQRLDNRDHSTAEDEANTSTTDRARSVTAFLSAADLLGNFRPPERQPIFKVEPTEPDIMKLPLRSSREPKIDRPSIYAIKPRKRATISKATAGKGKKNFGQDQGDAGENGYTHQDSPFVDLTGDDNEERAQSPRQYDNTTIQRQDRAPQAGIPAFLNSATNGKIPDATLQHIRERYRQDQINLPRNVTTWRQLEEFASANSKPSLITPALISEFRNLSSSNGVPQSSVGLVSQQDSSLFRDITEEPPNRNPFPAQNTTHASFAHGFAPRSGMHQQTAGSGARSRTITDNRFNTDVPPSTAAQHVSSRLSNKYNPPLTRSRLRSTNIQEDGNNVQLNHELRNSPHNNLPASIVVNINALLQPSEALPHLLPSSAPSDRPHLVSLWHPYLLKLPRGQHNHLDLIDTVVSIMFRYDMKEQSVIKAFLDMNEVQHFFFLFKSRTSAWHSWSLEREFSTVTVSCSFLVLRSCTLYLCTLCCRCLLLHLLTLIIDWS